MTRPLLTTLGAAARDRMRVCVVAEPTARAGRLVVRAGSDVRHFDVELKPAPPFAVGTLDASGLAPGEAVDYAVDVAGAPDGLAEPGAIIDAGSTRFRLLPADRPLRVGVVSCNGVHRVPEPSRYAMWERLAERVDAGDVDLLLHVGDQIYADAIHDELEARAGGAGPPASEEIERRYRQWTVDTWRAPAVAHVLGRVPSLMMWDDHDIYDGYGSNDTDDGAVGRACFRAAHAVFGELQAAHNPQGFDDDSYASGFRHGDTGVLLVDGRTHRRYADGVVVGSEQWAAVDRWLESNQGLRHLFVVLGVPPTHMCISIDLWVRELTPWLEPDTDDMRDSWSSKNNRPEAERLMDRLFGYQAAHPETRVTVLSGDVHVATLGRLTKGDACISQIVSSPIGYLPPRGVAAWMLRYAGIKTVEVAPGVRGELLELGETGEKLLPTRNFALLDLAAPREIQVRWYLENQDDPLQMIV